MSFLPGRLVRLHQQGDAWRVGRPRHLEVAAIFADVVGSTAMSEALARFGPAGTEEFSRIIDGVFAPLVASTHRHGGEVAQFAGDAVTAVFVIEPGTEQEVARRALRCALDMQAELERRPSFATTAGTFRIAVSIGAALGRAHSAILGDPESRLEHVIGGPALDACVAARERAGAGVVAAEPTLIERAHLAPTCVTPLAATSGTSLTRVLAVPGTSATPSGRPSPDLDPLHGPALARFLDRAVRSAVAAGQERLLQEHRKVTCLFLRHAGVEGVRGLQEAVAGAVPVLARFDGSLQRVDMTGDGGQALVVFGAPRAHDDDERRAVACALELLARPALKGARIGLNTGTVFCGILGSDARRQYTVLGDAVNVASRLVQAARPGQVVASEATRMRAGEAWSWSPLGPLRLKGRADRVTGYSPAPGRRRAPAFASRPLPPLVDRKAERMRAETLLDRAAGGAGSLLAITGAAGLGKTRLLEEVVLLARTRGFEVHRGAARPYGEESALLAWHDIVWSILDLDERDRDRAARALPGRLAAIHAGWGERAPLLASMLDLPALDKEEPSRGLPDEVGMDVLGETVMIALRHRQERSPLLIALEDAQWLDPLSRDLLEEIAEGVSKLKVLMVLTERTTGRETGLVRRLHALPSLSELALADLDPDAIKQIVHIQQARLDTPEGATAGDVVEAVVERAHGNPLYAEQLVEFLADPSRRGGADLSPGDLQLPETIRTLIMGRIDALSERERAVLKVASVIGPRFRASWLRGSYPELGTSAEIGESLATLSRLDVAPIDRSQAEPAHVFKHALVQEVTYDTLALATRQALHEGVARHIARTENPRRREVLDLLAHHYGRSANLDKQRVYFRAAGDAAKRTYLNQSAVAHYRRVLPLLDGDDRIDVLVELGEVLQLMGAWRDAEDLFQQALAHADAGGSPRLQARTRAALGTLFTYTRGYAQAVGLLEQARQRFAALGERQEVARVLERLGYAHFLKGEYDTAVQRCEEHRRLAGELDDLGGQSTAIETLGLVHWHRGELRRGRELLEEALELAIAAGHRINHIHALNDLAGVLVELGSDFQALERLRQALELAEELGYRRFSSAIMANAAEIYRRRGELDRALACLASAVDVAASLRDVSVLLLSANLLAMIRSEQGRLEDAERLLELVIEVAESADNRRFLGDALLEQARLERKRGRRSEAAALARRAAALAGEISHREVALEAQLMLVELTSAEAAERERRVARLLPDAEGDAERARILYALWTAEPTREDARREAAHLYRAVAERSGSAEARRRLRALSGEALPVPRPLPLLAAARAPARVRPPELVDRAVAALRRVRDADRGAEFPAATELT
jgi:class 3 adenylate cyclase/tetratricopeptide (TPR) repeat protein